MSADGEIIFRQIHGPRPRDWMAGMHWYVELHNECGYPLGTAYVSAHVNMRKTIGCEAYLDFILVVDHCRREGIATRLIEACRKRWPDIQLGEAISESGEGLLRALGEEEPA